MKHADPRNETERLIQRTPRDLCDQLAKDPELRLAEACEKFGIPLLAGRFVTTLSAGRLAWAFGFEWDAVWLMKQISAREFQLPDSFGVEFAWEAEDILRLFRFLTDHRRFRVAHHLDHKDETTIKRELALTRQAVAEVEYFRSMGLDELQHLRNRTTDERLLSHLEAVILEKSEPVVAD